MSNVTITAGSLLGSALLGRILSCCSLPLGCSKPRTRLLKAW